MNKIKIVTTKKGSKREFSNPPYKDTSLLLDNGGKLHGIMQNDEHVPGFHNQESLAYHH